eukprot:g3722.t1
MPKRGSRRKKTKTHVVPNQYEIKKVPKSFVVKHGRVGTGVANLVKDMRTVMLPHTALRLREKRTTRIKDFLKVARPLSVSHMVMFSQSEKGNSHVNIGCLPQGPTLNFKIERFSSAAAVRILQRAPVNTSTIFHSPPLVILNNFDTSSPHYKLVSTTFQNMFPTINVATVKLSSCKRVVLYNYDKETDQISFRHYAITARPAGLTRSVRRLVQAKIPNLGGATDVAEFLLGNAGMGPASDSEYEDESVRVTLTGRYTGRGNMKGNQSAIKLAELGPRMELKLVKVMKELFKGEVMYHAFVSKTEEEVDALRKTAELKRQRRMVQEANVKRKREAEADKAKEKAEKRQRRREQYEREKRDIETNGAGIAEGIED